MLNVVPLPAVERIGAVFAQVSPEPGGAGAGGISDGSWAVIASLVAGGLALLGAWLGHRWAEKSALRREREAERRQGAAVRRLLRFEIDANFGAMLAWWRTASAVNPRWEPKSAPELASKHARKIVATPFPPTSNRMWDAQAGSLAFALTDAQIGLCLRHYSGIQALHALQTHLIAVSKDDEARQNASPEMMSPLHGGPIGMRWPISGNFGDHAERYWPQVQQAAEDLLGLGVPLPPED